MEPSADIHFIGFSSRKVGKIALNGVADITGVSVKITEPILGLTVAEYELTEEEIASGEFSLPALDSGDLYMANMARYDKANAFPEELQLDVAVRYNSEEGEKLLEYSTVDSPEQGWGMMYWPDSEKKTDWSWPGYFRFSTYESLYPLTLVLDEPEKVQSRPENIVLSVSLSIDGRKILPEECEIVSEAEEDPFAAYYGSDEPVPTFYYSRIFLKRPDWAPEHGTVHMSVTQQLFADDSIWTTEEDFSY